MGIRFLITAGTLSVCLSFAACPVDLPQQKGWKKVDLERSVDEKRLLAEKEKRIRTQEAQALLKRRQIAFIQPEERVCESDEDCRLVADHCCSCERGGKMTAMRKDLFTEMVKRRVYGCEGYACNQAISTDPSCTAKKAQCVDRQCVVEKVANRPPEAQGIGVEPIEDTKPSSPAP